MTGPEKSFVVQVVYPRPTNILWGPITNQVLNVFSIWALNFFFYKAKTTFFKQNWLRQSNMKQLWWKQGWGSGLRWDSHIGHCVPRGFLKGLEELGHIWKLVPWEKTFNSPQTRIEHKKCLGTMAQVLIPHFKFFIVLTLNSLVQVPTIGCSWTFHS